MNPLALVPVLTEGNLRLSQSPAILEYLDERYPLPPLLPASIEDRSRARQLASTIACEIHPRTSRSVVGVAGAAWRDTAALKHRGGDLINASDLLFAC